RLPGAAGSRDRPPGPGVRRPRPGLHGLPGGPAHPSALARQPRPADALLPVSAGAQRRRVGPDPGPALASARRPHPAGHPGALLPLVRGLVSPGETTPGRRLPGPALPDPPGPLPDSAPARPALDLLGRGAAAIVAGLLPAPEPGHPAALGLSPLVEHPGS